MSLHGRYRHEVASELRKMLRKSLAPQAHHPYLVRIPGAPCSCQSPPSWSVLSTLQRSKVKVLKHRWMDAEFHLLLEAPDEDLGRIEHGIRLANRPCCPVPAASWKTPSLQMDDLENFRRGGLGDSLSEPTAGTKPTRHHSRALKRTQCRPNHLEATAGEPES